MNPWVDTLNTIVLWHHHTLLMPATLSGWACARSLVLRNTSRSCLSCGPQFASQAFSDFCRQWDIHHVLSSLPPRLPWRPWKRSSPGTPSPAESTLTSSASGYWNSGIRRRRMASVLPNSWMAGRFAPSCSLTRPPWSKSGESNATLWTRQRRRSWPRPNPSTTNTPVPSQSLPPAQSSMWNTHTPSGGTRSPRSSGESLAVTATPSRQRAGEYRRGMWHHHTVLVPATLSGRACVRPLVLHNTSRSCLSCSLGLWVLNIHYCSRNLWATYGEHMGHI